IAVIILCVSFHMETGSRIQCKERGGFCSSVRCRPPLRTIGRCSDMRPCPGGCACLAVLWGR
uniref:Beta-defensin-like domain-containing protein n=1 Tax=Geospiza parvula TaxID=87175 RepID=A0A8C3N5T3_GEOPR